MADRPVHQAFATDARDRPPADSPRLLAGIRPERPLRLAEHVAVHGALPAVRSRRGSLSATGRRSQHPVVAELAASGLTGRGGAGFPFARKLAAVAEASPRPAVVVNVAESEPAAMKDAVLATRSPHLILDGAEVVARVLGAREVIVWTHRGAEQVSSSLQRAIGERPDAGLRWQIVAGPDRYVAGEASAVVRHLSGGPAKPTTSPPRVDQRGVDGRPTLLSNAETYAQVALIVRHGAAWFRQVGTADEPGTILVTLAGSVHAAGVVEVPFGTRLGDLLTAHGGTSEPVDAVLVGGFAGRWLPWSTAADLRLSREAFRAAGAELGVGLMAFLPARRCGLAETARLTRWLAGESAGQCGPCLNGLPSIANALDHLVRAGDVRTPPLIRRWAGQVRGRGACHHPDGVAGLVTSALEVFAAAVDDHVMDGSCAGCREPAVFAVPQHGVLTEASWR